jgi:hypothetical protein
MLARKLRHQMRWNEFTNLAEYGTLIPGCTGWHNDNLLLFWFKKIVASQSAMTNSPAQMWDASA